MATTTNYGWTTPNDTDLVKDGASAIRTLGTAIDTTVFNNASAAIAKTIVDAKGDLIVASGADAVARLAVGSNDQVLIADSTATNGLKWGTPPGVIGLSKFAMGAASTGSGGVTVTFPTGRFSAAPYVTCSTTSDGRLLYLSSVTSTNFFMYGLTANAGSYTNVGFQWMAGEA